jgi:hypothetical protein
LHGTPRLDEVQCDALFACCWQFSWLRGGQIRSDLVPDITAVTLIIPFCGSPTDA